MIGFLRNVEAIAGSPNISPRSLASTYARLRVGRPRSVGRVRILGWEVSYADYGAVVRLFEEIFLRRHYPFRPSVATPFVVDCGANIGVSMLFFKTLASRAEILAFEPEPTAFRLLTENVELNGLDSVDCRPVAVSRQAGRQILWSPAPAHGGASLELRGPGWTEREVETVRLSDCLAGRRVDFLKLDVEGSENNVLADLAETGALRRVEEIGVEHHPHTPEDLPSLLKVLAEAGFGYRIALGSDAFWDQGQLLLIHAFRAAPDGSMVYGAQ